MTPARAALVATLVALPWLNPMAAGPSTTGTPLLFAWFSVAALVAASPAMLPGLALPAAAAVAWVWIATGPGGAFSVDSAGAAGALTCVLAAAAVGRAAASVESMRMAIARGWLAAATISAVMGLLQYFGAEHHFGGLINAAGGQAYGNLRQRNQFGTLMSIGLAVLIWGSLREGSMAGYRRWTAMAAAALMAVAAAASASRTSFTQLAMVAVFLLLWHGRRALAAWSLAGVAWAAYLLGTAILPGTDVFDRMGAGGPACASRLTLWSNVLDLIAARPWTGWGWGELDFAHFQALYAAPRFCDILDNAHNLPLHIAVELGVPAALLACGAAAVFVWRRRPLREASPERQLAWVVAGLILLHSLLEYPLWYGPFQIAFGLCIGLLLPRGASRGGDQPGIGLSSAVRFATAAAVTVAVLFAAWDYRRMSQIYLPPEARAPEYRDNTLAKAKQSFFFANHALFAELTITPLTRANAEAMHAQALALLHYSPEPRVVEKLIESAVYTGRDEEALAWLVRFKAAFPEDYERWRASGVLGSVPKRPGPATP